MAGDATSDGDRRQLSADQLAAILADHEAWLGSDGKEKVRADFKRTNLQGRNLRGVRLERADFTDADLTDTDLSQADVHGASFGKAILTRTLFHDADTRDTDLADGFGLLAEQLAGADLTRARLPGALGAFESLKQADRIVDNAQKLYFVLLGACAYSILTIATTNDARLLTNSATSPLPIIQTAVPIAGFYWIAPLLLAGSYFYFHLYLQRLWEALAHLPAVFPDGVSVDRKVDPWLLTGLLRRHVRRLSGERPTFARLHTAIALLSAWWTTPVVLVLFWGRYLRRHDWWGTSLQVFLLATTFAGAAFLYSVARATLRRSGQSETRRRRLRWIALAASLMVAGGVVSLGAIEGDARHTFSFTEPGSWVPRVMDRIFGYNPFADLRGADVSTRPTGWADKQEQIELVTGAQLQEADLRRARAARAFLIKANLKGARLQEADLEEARLERADFGPAQVDMGTRVLERRYSVSGVPPPPPPDFFEEGKRHLLTAMLKGRGSWTRLDGANLRDARLDGANLRGAELNGADLRGARLDGANLGGASLLGADLGGASLAGADLSGASLNGATLSGASMKGANLKMATLDGANLSGASLNEANLEQATLRGANLAGTDFGDAWLKRTDLSKALLAETKLEKARCVTREQIANAIGDVGSSAMLERSDDPSCQRFK